MKFGPETLSTQNLIVVVSTLTFDPLCLFLDSYRNLHMILRNWPFQIHLSENTVGPQRAHVSTV